MFHFDELKGNVCLIVMSIATYRDWKMKLNIINIQAAFPESQGICMYHFGILGQLVIQWFSSF